MKRSICIVTILLILGLSGCIGTKIYLGKEKEVKQDQVLRDEGLMSRAIDPTEIPAGGTWGTIRGILNTNFSNVNGSLDSIEVTLAEYGDSITAYSTDINLRLLKSDTASMLANYTRNGELATALAAKVNVSDTAAMLAPYALTSELGDAGAGDVIGLDTIAEYQVVLWAGQDTLTGSPGLRYSYSGSGSFAVYGYSTYLNTSVNSFGTATSGTGILSGRSSRASALLNTTSTTSTPNILIDRSFSESGIGGVRDTAIGFITNNVMRFSSHDNRNESYVLLKTSVPTAGSAGFRLPHGVAPTSPVNGDLWTTTAGIFAHINSSTDTLATQAYARQYGGTGTVTMSDVQNEIADSLNLLRPTVVMNSDSTGNAPGNYVTHKALQDSITNLVSGGIEGVALADSVDYANGYMTRYDGVTGLAQKVNISDTTSMLSAYILSSEVAGTYAPIANPTFTGIQKVGTTDTLATQSYARTYGGSGTVTESDVEALITANARLNVDTTFHFVFGAGAGNTIDTACFTTSTLYGAFYNAGSDTLVITELRAVMVAGSTPLGTDTLAIQVYWNDSINVTTGASVTLLNSAALGINSVTTGTSDTSFANSKIPPNVWVFMKSPGVVTGRKPNMLVATLIGYKKRNW